MFHCEGLGLFFFFFQLAIFRFFAMLKHDDMDTCGNLELLIVNLFLS